MGSSTTKTTNETRSPWEPQQPYLLDAFQRAQNTLNQTNANVYTGPHVAQFTPEQLATFQQMVNYGSNASGLPNTAAQTGTTLANAGASGVTSALTGLSGFTPQGGVNSNIEAATAYANNPAIQGTIDAAMRDARRQVSEQALPQIARSSALTGNTMSSRRAISEGLVERGLAEKTADVSANVRNDAFQRGLQLAEAGRQADTSAILDALKAQGTLGGTAAAAGVGALGDSIAQQGALFDIANKGAAGPQAAAQAAIENAKLQTMSPNEQLWQNLLNYFSVIGNPGFGGQGHSVSETESSPSPFSVIGGILGAGGSFLKSDERVKTDIKRVGTLDNGLPIYSYRYRDMENSPTFIGLLAQDVMRVKPEAVREFNGVLHVNYDLATEGSDRLQWRR